MTLLIHIYLPNGQSQQNQYFGQTAAAAQALIDAAFAAGTPYRIELR
jgi:hypothetical protein